MIDYLAIRDALVNALSTQLGTYTFSSGASTPAVQIDDGSDPSPVQPQVTGLELVIIPNLRVPISLGLADSFRQTFSGQVTVRQWDITQTTLGAMPIILEALRSQDLRLTISGMERVIRSLKLDNVETLTVQISQEFFMD